LCEFQSQKSFCLCILDVPMVNLLSKALKSLINATKTTETKVQIKVVEIAFLIFLG
jgi:hypothetical protein